MNSILDWKGNAVKAGDEVCFIKIIERQYFRAAFMIPLADGGYTEFMEDKIPDRQCWERGDYHMVDYSLCITTEKGKFTFTQPLSFIISGWNGDYILAIKGVSDQKPDEPINQ